MVDSFCAVAKPITWSPKDTDATLEQIKAHNLIGVRICHWGTARPPEKFPNSEAATPPV